MEKFSPKKFGDCEWSTVGVRPAVLALTYRAPSLELHGLHRTLRLSGWLASSGLSKLSVGRMWSMVLASRPQMLQVGSSARSRSRCRLKSAVALAFAFLFVAMFVVLSLCLFSSALGCACGCFRVLPQGPTLGPPTVRQLSLTGRRLSQDRHHSRFSSSYSAQVSYPRSHSSKSSQDSRRTRLPAFPRVLPAERNSQRGRGCDLL